MPTGLPERLPSPREEAVPVAFLFGTLAVATLAIALSVAFLGPAESDRGPASGSDRGYLTPLAEQPVAIGLAP